MGIPIIKTASWASRLPDDHLRIGISRGVPRRLAGGYRLYRKLSPGPWFNSVEVEEYYHRYRREVLGLLDPRAVARELTEMAQGGIPVMLCFEKVDGKSWCHRAMAAEWLAEALGRPVPEVGFEGLPQQQHPLMPAELRRRTAATEAVASA